MQNKTIQTAIKIGFDFSQFDDDEIQLCEVYQKIIEFLSENSDKLKKAYDKCEVSGNGHRQNVNHGDYSSSGEIINWSDFYGEKRKRKIYHSEYMMIDNNGTPLSMNLWCWSK